MNKIRVLASAIVCFMSFLIVTIPVKATGTTYSGSNVEAQNYSTWSSTVESYLVPTDKGLMRVQAANSIDGYLVEYYDANYNVTSSKIIAEELPIWGGFYQSETYGYFIVTGQTNWDESADVEVVRITRYDENWKRIGSTGLYNCNTTIPFDAGSLRMAEYDKYLFIRTSHEMYQSSDGYNHQANMTIRVNMSAMSIVDSYCSVMNITYGYASHSFNQFVKVDDGKLVAVDHGDAYPRSVALFQYPNKVTDSNFSIYGNGHCKTTHVLPFSTAYGLVNPTGASVGSFEVSSTNYLVAGNSVVQDDNALSKSTRNIYVAAVSKETNEVTINWITSDAEGSITNSTPHMVPIANDKYLLMWSKKQSTGYAAESDVYYTVINGKGQKVGNIYHFEANLSDCVPVVQGTKVIWYTWKDETVKFYEIDTKDMSAKVMYKDGLVLEDGVWKYYEDNQWMKDKKGLVEYEGELFLVMEGYLRNDINGLCLTPTADGEIWYFYSAGQVQKHYTGFAEYNGAWFYLNKGELDTTKTGIYKYDNGFFLLAEGRLIKEYKGLYQNTKGPGADNKWYYFGDGKLQDQYTGLAYYDGKWFYLKKGCLAEDYTGKVIYDGKSFNVVNGEVKE